MAGIPISEIPNAPRILDPSLIKRGGARGADISGTTRTLLGPKMSAAGAGALGDAYGKLGKGVRDLSGVPVKVAAVLAHWDQVYQEGRDVNTANQHEVMRRDFMAEMGKQLPLVPVGQRADYFRKQLPILHKVMATVPISEGRAEAEAEKQASWERQNYATIFTESRKEEIEGWARAGLANYYAKLSADDVEGADRGLAEMKDGLLLSEKQYAAERAKGDAMIMRNHSARYLANNPRGMLKDLDESLKTGGEVGGVKWTRDEALAYRRQAVAAITQREVEVGYSAHQAILKGEIADEAALRQRVQDDVPEERITSLARLIHNDPDYEPAALTQLRTEVRSFSPASDRDQSSYFALQERIESSVPKNMQAAFTDELRQAWKTRGQHDAASATRQQQAGYFRQIDSLVYKGLIGDTDHPVSAQNAETMKADIERFMKATPQATSREIRSRIGDLAMEQGLLKKGASLFQQRFFPRL